MQRIGILADDLTGALDAAAPFAAEDRPIAVSWVNSWTAQEDFAFDSETRALAPEIAGRRVMSLIARLHDTAVSFKKIDSLMRGNTFPELVACCTHGWFASVVIAPAFPAEDRITRCGRQIAPCGDNARPIEIDLADSLRRNGVPIRVVGREDEAWTEGVSVCDAETDGDLDRLVDLSAGFAEPILWCGTAGLARALSRHAGRTRSAPKDGSRLLIVGSRHPVSVAQTTSLRRERGNQVIVIEAAGDIPDAAAAASDKLAGGQSVALVFALPPCAAEEAEALFRAAFSQLSRGPRPGILTVVGGDTLFRLCQEAGASRLHTIGEWFPGVALSRLADGAWEGITVVSKSGAFGDRDILVRLFDAGQER